MYNILFFCSTSTGRALFKTTICLFFKKKHTRRFAYPGTLTSNDIAMSTQSKVAHHSVSHSLRHTKLGWGWADDAGLVTSGIHIAAFRVPIKRQMQFMQRDVLNLLRPLNLDHSSLIEIWQSALQFNVRDKQ